jgi:hypothetical protein
MAAWLRFHLFFLFLLIPFCVAKRDLLNLFYTQSQFFEVKKKKKTGKNVNGGGLVNKRKRWKKIKGTLEVRSTRILESDVVNVFSAGNLLRRNLISFTYLKMFYLINNICSVVNRTVYFYFVASFVEREYKVNVLWRIKNREE